MSKPARVSSLIRSAPSELLQTVPATRGEFFTAAKAASVLPFVRLAFGMREAIEG
jgi:hypothetical protein